jgi:GAF domain-containing protein
MSESDPRTSGDPLLTCLEWPAIPQIVEQVLNDSDRLEAVRETGLLDAEEDAAFERLVAIAAKALNASKSAITLLESHRQYFVSRTGFDQREDPIARSFCQYAASMAKTMVISDTSSDPILKDNPAARGGIRSYLGVPLITQDGHALGTVCVFGDEPREWSADDVAVLTELSRSVMTEIELRASLQRAGLRPDGTRSHRVDG